MKNKTCNDGTSEYGDMDEPLITAEAEAVFRSAVANDSRSNEAKEQEEDSEKSPIKENYELVAAVPENVMEDNDFDVGTREEVNGAAAAFFGAGFLFFGPILGLVTGAIASHAAANKRGPVGSFCRKCGSLLDGIGKDKKRPRQPEATAQAIVVAQPQDHRPKGLWSKITDEMVSGAQYIEGRIFVGSNNNNSTHA